MRVDLNDAILASGEAPARKLVLIAIASFINGSGDKSWPSLNTLGRLVSMHPSTVSRIIKGLIKSGALVRQRRFAASSIYSVAVHSLQFVKNDDSSEIAHEAKMDCPDAIYDEPSKMTEGQAILAPSSRSFLHREQTNRPDEPSIEPPTKKARFVKPTLEEVTAYCVERGRGVDPEKWLAHYEANGWKVGKNPMKDWRAAVRTWERGRSAAPVATAPDDVQKLMDQFSHRLKGGNLNDKRAAFREAAEAFEFEPLCKFLRGLDGAIWPNELMTVLRGGSANLQCPHPEGSPEWMDWHVAKAGRL